MIYYFYIYYCYIDDERNETRVERNQMSESHQNKAIMFNIYEKSYYFCILLMKLRN